MIVEYNLALARQTGPAAMVALILHSLLHLDMHPRDERPLNLT